MAKRGRPRLPEAQRKKQTLRVLLIEDDFNALDDIVTTGKYLDHREVIRRAIRLMRAVQHGDVIVRTTSNRKVPPSIL